MDKLFALLELQHRAQDSQTRDALLHTIVNETLKTIPYTQAVFFSPDTFSIQMERASGNAAIDPQGLYAAAIKKSVSEAIKDKVTRLTLLPAEGNNPHRAILFFRTDVEGFLGGLWLERDTPYSEAEQRILDELTIIYAQCLALWHLRQSTSFLSSFKTQGKWKKYTLIGVAILALLPVRMSLSAPAEIIAKEAQIITAPFDGLIETIEVEPGDEVKAEDLLVTMESQSLQAQMDIAQQEILVAQSALSRMQRESLASPEKKMNLVELQEAIESKRISHDYAQSMKARSEIRAPESGVAVFSGSHSLKGKPVHTGEKIMTIANPAQYELLIRAPVDSMIEISEGSKVSFFLNLSPLKSYKAEIHSIGYQASTDPDGLMTYKILATLPDNQKDMRIGWKGTAHVKGAWTILSYSILRRPLITLRNLMGL